MDSKQYAKYQNPSSSGSQNIVLTRFLYCYNGGIKIGNNFAILGPTKKNMRSLIFCTDVAYKISRFYTNWFPRFSRHLIFTKRGITLAIFDALRLKVYQHIFIW